MFNDARIQINHFKTETIKWNWNDNFDDIYIASIIENMELVNSKQFKRFGVWISYDKLV